MQAIIEQELGNSEFTMEDFAARMKLGRTVFSKKVRGLTGHTPNEYFRIIRLKKAAELLLEGNYNVSEVSYKVGISDPLYFSRCFKTHYGVSPSVYLRGKEKEISSGQPLLYNRAVNISSFLKKLKVYKFPC